MARKWLEGAAVLRQETLTQPFTKCTDKRADELISASLRKIDISAASCYSNYINVKADKDGMSLSAFL